jgi:hypothetical protein
MKKIAKLDYFRDVVSEIRGVCVWLRRHAVPLAVFKQLTSKAIQIPGETRFGSTVLCLERFVDKDVLEALKNMFSNKRFTTWEHKQPKNARIKSALARKIVFDGQIRSKAKLLVRVLSPIMRVLRLFDRGVPVIGFVYFAIADMRSKTEKLLSEQKVSNAVKVSVLAIIDNQWELFASDMHAAAYILNPRYYHLIHDLIDDKELRNGVHCMIKKLSTSAEMSATAWHQFKQKYVRGLGEFGSDQFMKAAANEAIAPHEVWDEWGEDVPELQHIAVRILSVFPQATACERNWKDLSCTHTRVRNRLSKGRAEKLVFVKGNRRALERTRMLPEEQFNWVGADVEAELDDSDGESVDDMVLDIPSDSDDEEEIADSILDEVTTRILCKGACAWESDDED